MTQQTSVGVLLVNLGTPDAPTSKAVRTYLAEFLHDKRVVDLSRWIWCPVLHGVILRVRPPKVAKLYQSIWTEQGSPLLVIGQQQQQSLQLKLNDANINASVELAMTYGNPSIAAGMNALSHCKKVIVLPLYPQFSSATTASVFDRVARFAKEQWVLPELTFVRDYYDHPLYIKALAESVKSSWQSKGRGDVLLMSFHGIPKRYATNGDPYPEQCQATAKLLAEELSLNDSEWQMTYQSIFGREEWLSPFTDKTMEQLGKQGKSVDVICPGFSADCLETLEEIEEENKSIFLRAGGKGFNYIACLNNDAAHIDALFDVIKSKLN